MNDHALRIYDSILGLLCNADNPTPLVRLNRVSPFRHTQVYAKLEWFNPFGAVKDRVAANLVADGEERHTVHAHQKLVEPTSGNTGMGLAMIANAKGYSLTTPQSSEIPLEKRTMLRFFGADVLELEDTLCPAPGAPEGAIAKAMEIADRPEFHMLNQYANEANPEAHYKTTGPEIWRQTQGWAPAAPSPGPDAFSRSSARRSRCWGSIRTRGTIFPACAVCASCSRPSCFAPTSTTA